MKLDELTFERHPLGFQAIALYPNGFGMSIIPENDGETYEVAVLDHSGKGRYKITYESGLTTDVFRWLERDEVDYLADKVKAL